MLDVSLIGLINYRQQYYHKLFHQIFFFSKRFTILITYLRIEKNGKNIILLFFIVIRRKCVGVATMMGADLNQKMNDTV